jgi:hypothetical protein
MFFLRVKSMSMSVAMRCDATAQVDRGNPLVGSGGVEFGLAAQQWGFHRQVSAWARDGRP